MISTGRGEEGVICVANREKKLHNCRPRRSGWTFMDTIGDQIVPSPSFWVMQVSRVFVLNKLFSK